MFSDVLGVVIAFISIILLLSILVTALVQTTQAALRLRSRNLMTGLALLLMKVQGDDPDDKDAQRRARRDAARVLNAPNIALLNRVGDPASLWNRIFGPRVTWIDPDELPAAWKHAHVNGEKENGESVAETIAEDFRKIERPLQKRFKFIMRWWTFAFGFFVAFVFQVSTPHLLGQLMQDSDRRDRIIADAEDLLAHQEEALANISYEYVAPKALEQLQTKYPDQRDRIEEVAGVGTNHLFLLEEMRLALDGVANSKEIVEDYDALLRELAEKEHEKLAGEVDSTLQRLTDYGILFWKDGWKFYYDSKAGFKGNALIGVLVTAVLLSLGAPFWYERLRDAILLRDVLAGRPARDV